MAVVGNSKYSNFVYLIYDAWADMYKIGRSKKERVKSRIRGLKTKWGYDVTDILLIVETENALSADKLEDAVLDKYQKGDSDYRATIRVEERNGKVRKVIDRRNGYKEWFSLSKDEDINDVIDMIKDNSVDIFMENEDYE